MESISPKRLAVAPPVLLEPTDEVAPFIAHPLQQRLGGVPGIKEHILRATAEAIARLAEQLYG
jgi:hypothetical protein